MIAAALLLMRRLVRAGLTPAVLASVILTGCGVAPVPSLTLPSVTVVPPTPTAVTFPMGTQTARPVSPVPTAPHIDTAPPPSAPIRTFDTSGPFACAGIGLIEATLQGDVNDPRVAWIAVKDHGTLGVIFPKGFTAHFKPNLEILDATGQVKFRAGDSIDGGCVWGQQDLLIGWP